MTPSTRLPMIETFPYLTTVGLEGFRHNSLVILRKKSDSPCAPLFQCTASCGGGFQKRTVYCVSSEDNKTEDQDRCLCDHEPRPLEFQNCNQQACRKSAGESMALLTGRELLINKLCVNSFSSLYWARNLNVELASQHPWEQAVWFDEVWLLILFLFRVFF